MFICDYFKQQGRNSCLGIPVRLSPGAARLRWCRPLNFLQPSGPPVALASFPGSGNTWLRYLLQQATGEYCRRVFRSLHFFRYRYLLRKEKKKKKKRILKT